MAKDKKSFLLYCDIIHMVKKLTNEQAGELFKHVLAYVNDENPIAPNQLIDIIFEPIKQQLKRDLDRWEVEIENFSKSGRLGNLKKYNKDLYKDVLSKKITLEDAENIAIDRKMSPPDTTLLPPVASVAVNVNVNVIDINKEFDNFRKIYPGKKRGNQTEFANFKKHKDWKEILPTLKSSIENQIKEYDLKVKSKLWVPEWANLQTWINQRRWELVINTPKETAKPILLKKPDYYINIKGEKIPVK